MVIRRMEPSNVGAVAKLMSAIKPDWWDFEGANQQLQDVGLLAKLVVNLGVNVGLGALWSSMLYGKGYYYYLVKSLIKNIGMLPIETVLLFLFFKAILPAASRAGLLPEQKKISLW